MLPARAHAAREVTPPPKLQTTRRGWCHQSNMPNSQSLGEVRIRCVKESSPLAPITTSGPAAGQLQTSPAGRILGVLQRRLPRRSLPGESAYALAAGDEGYVLPVAAAEGAVDLEAHPLAAVNEPPPGAAANAAFYELSVARHAVPHIPPRTDIAAVGLWAAADIPVDEEVFALYGGEYARTGLPGRRVGAAVAEGGAADPCCDAGRARAATRAAGLLREPPKRLTHREGGGRGRACS